MIKPDAVAHGKSVNGAVYINGENYYFPASGGAVSSAVVTGVIALVWSAVPELKNDVANTFRLLRESSNPIESSDCFSEQDYPNFVYGYGSIDAESFYQKALEFAEAQNSMIEKGICSKKIVNICKSSCKVGIKFNKRKNCRRKCIKHSKEILTNADEQLDLEKCVETCNASTQKGCHFLGKQWHNPKKKCSRRAARKCSNITT